MENPVQPPFWTNIPSPPSLALPPPPPFLFVCLFIVFSQISLLMKINILALVIPENKFSGRIHVVNN